MLAGCASSIIDLYKRDHVCGVKQGVLVALPQPHTVSCRRHNATLEIRAKVPLADNEACLCRSYQALVASLQVPSRSFAASTLAAQAAAQQQLCSVAVAHAAAIRQQTRVVQHKYTDATSELTCTSAQRCCPSSTIATHACARGHGNRSAIAERPSAMRGQLMHSC